MSRFRSVAIAGAGAFGTALAIVAARAGRDVTLWGRDAGQIAVIRAERENSAYLPGVAVPLGIEITHHLRSFGEVDILILAVPAQATRATMTALAPHLAPGLPVVAAAKGIEQSSGLLQAGIIAACAPDVLPAALSGPGFAEEIARGLPTAVTIAARDIALAHDLASALSSDAFRPYASDDLIGVELGGALKNVLAIAAGIVAGRRLGESARAALIARGLAEMMRLGETLGARPETFMGLSGIGDLVLTATSEKSRNTTFGMALGAGRAIAELLAPGEPLVEGAYTARIAADLAMRHRIETPIIDAVAAIIDGRIGVDAAIEGLVSRPLKAENA